MKKRFHVEPDYRVFHFQVEHINETKNPQLSKVPLNILCE